MTTYLGKSCSFCLPRVPFVNCRQFMYLVISLFGFEGRIWDLNVSVPDHCLSFYFVSKDFVQFYSGPSWLNCAACKPLQVSLIKACLLFSSFSLETSKLFGTLLPCSRHAVVYASTYVRLCMQCLCVERLLYWTTERKNVTCISNASLLLTEVMIGIFYFIPKCKNVFKALKMNITTKAVKLEISLIPGGVKIWKRNFEMHFKDLWLPMCAIPFPDVYQTPLEVMIGTFYFIPKCKNVFTALKMNITTEAVKLEISLIPGGVKIWKRNFEMHFKDLWLPMCAIHFPDVYQTPLVNKTFK